MATVRRGVDPSVGQQRRDERDEGTRRLRRGTVLLSRPADQLLDRTVPQLLPRFLRPDRTLHLHTTRRQTRVPRLLHTTVFIFRWWRTTSSFGGGGGRGGDKMQVTVI